MTAVRRMMTILLAFGLVLSMVPAALAAGEEDTYILARPETYEQHIQYGSAFLAQYSLGGKVSSLRPALYTMRNQNTGFEFPTYCLDIDVPATIKYTYRRLNLEDSTYSGSVAGRVRAIMRQGFYLLPGQDETVESLKARAMPEVERLKTAAGFETDEVLTVSEAISATQCAIWQVCHGSVLSFPNFAYKLQKNYNADKYGGLCSGDERKPPNNLFYLDNTDLPAFNDRIRRVYDYLLSLDPVSATDTTVSPASFTQLSAPVFTPSEDGTTYTVSVTATVDVTMYAGDFLTLEASLGDYSQTAALHDGSQEVSLTIEGVPAELAGQEVTLSISGYQTANGVFMFDAKGDRNAAQTMVARDNSRLPVYAEVTAQESRILKFRKTTGNYEALPGIIFDIYPVGSLEDYRDLPDPEKYELPELATYTVITDANGQASLNLTNHGLPDGIYLVVEQDHPAIVSPIDPFYVAVPSVNSEGSGYDYEVLLEPKNIVKADVEIKKDVISLDNNSASVDAYRDHTWIISVSIPNDIAQGKSYVITDTLDNRLDYAGNLRVVVETGDGQTVLTEDTDYTLALTDADSLSEEKPRDAFTVELTPTGMTKAANGTMLRVYFDAKINANAKPAEQIPNQSTLDYTNSLGFAFQAKSDIPEVHTGGANLLKVDSADNNQKLAGAVFEVYRPATAAEIDANVGLTTLPGVSAPVIKTAFFDNAALTGEKVTFGATDENGKLAIYGLAYGTYYLVETQSPAGYNRMDAPTELTINENSHLEGNAVSVENSTGMMLPETGGMGTGGYAFAGVTLMAASILLLLEKKRGTFLSAG